MKCYIRRHFINAALGDISRSALLAKTKNRITIHHFTEILTGNPLKYKMDNSILMNINMYRIINQIEKALATTSSYKFQ